MFSLLTTPAVTSAGVANIESAIHEYFAGRAIAASGNTSTTTSKS
jgi:hypothetical protein